MSDVSLLQRWRREGDADAFRTFAQAHAGLIYGVCRRVLQNAHDAEDAAQECFLTISRTAKLPRGNVATWLHVVALNQARKHLRTEQRRRTRESAYASGQPGAAAPTWDEISPLIDEAIAALPDSLREPLIAHYFEGQTHGDIAKAANVSRQTVTHRVGQGVERVRETLKERFGVSASASVLTGLLTAHGVEAAPAAVLAAVGKIAVAGTVTASSGGAAVVGKIAAAVLLIALLGGGGFWGFQSLRQVPQSETVNAGVDEASVGDLARTDESDTVPSPPGDAAVPADGPDGQAVRVADGAADSERVALARRNGPAASASSNGSRVSGTVVLPSGQGLVNAHVTLEGLTGQDNGKFRMDTGDGGAFVFDDVPAGTYSVQVSYGEQVSGKIYELTQVAITSGADVSGLRVVFGSEGNLEISGKVVDSQGRALEGARVACWGAVRRNAITDTSGAFTLAYLPEGAYNVNADHNEYTGSGVEANAGISDVVIVLKGKGALRGRVVDGESGAPLDTFKAGYINGHRRDFSDSNLANMHGFSDSDGWFEFDDVYVGDLTVTAMAEGYAPAVALVTLEEHDTVSDIVLKMMPSTALTGRVVTTSGTPVAGAKVYFGRARRDDMQQSDAAAVTEADGSFRIEDAPGNVAIVSASHPDFVPNGGQVTEDTILVLSRPARLDITVTDEGRPMAGATIRAYGFDMFRGYLEGARTNEAGVAEIVSLQPGEYDIKAGASDDRFLTKRISIPEDESQSLSFDFVPANGVVEGHLLVNGVPAARGQLEMTIETDTGREELTAMADADGYYRFASVPAGSADLLVKAFVGAMDQPEQVRLRSLVVPNLVIEDGVAMRRDFDLTGDGSLSGVAPFADAAGLAVWVLADTEVGISVGGPVDMLRISRATVGLGEVGADGTFQVDELEPGTYYVALVRYEPPYAADMEVLAITQVTVSQGSTAQVQF